MEVCLKDIRPGMTAVITRIEDAPMGERLRQFALVPGTMVRCLCGDRLVALELMGTVVALRRKDLAGLYARVSE